MATVATTRRLHRDTVGSARVWPDLVRLGEAWPTVGVDDAGGVLALTLRKDGGRYDTLFASYRSPDGSWAEATQLTRGSGNSSPAVGVGAHGFAVAVWLHTGPERRRTAVMSRTRNPDGTWGPLHRLTGYHRDVVFDPRVQVGAGGAAVVSWYQESQLHAAYRAPGGTWSTQLVAANGDGVRLAVDDSGTAYLAYRSGRQVLLTTCTPAGQWSGPEVMTGGREIGGFDFAVDGSGSRALAVVALDDRAAVAGRLRMLRQHEPGAPMVEDWTVDGAFDPRLAVAGGHIRLLWQRAGGQLSLHTSAFDGEWSPVRTIDTSAPAGSRYLGYQLDVRSDGHGLLAYHGIDPAAGTTGPWLLRTFGPGEKVSAERILDSHGDLRGEGGPVVAIGEHGQGVVGWVERPNSDRTTVRVRTIGG